MHSYLKISLFLLLGGLALMPQLAWAQLTVIPTRILFEGRDRFEEITIVNVGSETRTYDLNWEFLRMLEGQVSPIYDRSDVSLTDFDLTKHIVFTPRRVTLPPDGRQKIRLALRRPAEVPDGEYRAHLKFSPQSPLKNASESGDADNPSAAVNVLFGYSIPVVFRSGLMDVQITIDSLELQRNQKSGRLEALVTLGRSGKHGVLGHLYIYDEAGNKIGEIGNAHVFPEVDSRIVSVPLITDDLSGQTITVTLKHYDSNENITFSQRQFPLR